jgi:type IV pilus assembly protein PilQ
MPAVAAVRRERPARPAPRAGFNGQRISLDFKDADIQNVLRVLADVSGLNIIATDDVKGKVTLHLTDVPWDQALDLVLRSNRLEMIREGNVVRISTVNRLKEEREALRAAQDAEQELEPLRVRYVRVNYARADDALVDKVKGVLTDRGSVTFDERTNTIIVRDIARGIEDAAELVRQLDVQSPQVLIEANIVEATESFARALGVQWGYQYNQGPLNGNPTGSNFPGTVGVGGSGLGSGVPPTPSQPGVTPSPVPFIADFPVPSGFNGAFGPGAGSALDLALGSIDGAHSISARLTALEEQGKGRVISRPRVITMNNVAATIQSLTILRVKLPSTGTVINTGTGGAAGSASTATEKINTGITLVVTPQISADGYVLMSIYAKSSQPDFTRTVDGIPNEISREANSNVLIQDGNTVVLGGIFRQTADDRETGLPYLRRIPALGWLFKRMLKQKQNDELLVFLTPKIVSTGTASLPSAERLWEERRHGG